VEPPKEVRAAVRGKERLGGVTVERVVVEAGSGMPVPLLLLLPAGKAGEKVPVVVAVSQGGKAEFLAKRSAEVAELLESGVAVCLPDLRGTGETRAEGDLRAAPAGRLVAVQQTSAATLIACEELMLGQTLLGSRLRDLRTVLGYLRGRSELESGRVALWGESFATENPAEANLEVPWDAEKLPSQSEPMGALVALLGGFFEDDVTAVAASGGLVGFRSVLDDPFCFLPHDTVVPRVLTVGDLGDVAAALAPRVLRVDRAVDGRNVRVSAEALGKAYEPARAAYRDARAGDRLALGDARQSVGRWLAAHLKASDGR
jgi:hypothetical protein